MLTHEQFIERSNKIHNFKYDYIKTEYTTGKNDITIICPVHGEFIQKARYHLSGNGCQKCGGRLPYTTESFLDKITPLFEKHAYNYSFSEYKNNRTNIKIICEEHGEFERSPTLLLSGKGCQKCSYNASGVKRMLTQEEFIQRSEKEHNNKYDYTFSIYTGRQKKVDILCPTHGVFSQTAEHHMSGSGCPKCRRYESKGEERIRVYFENNGIEYIQQKWFKDLKYRSYLYFDFYLPKYNMCVEFDGIQHFEPTTLFGITYLDNKDVFYDLQKRDGLKNEYCLNNNIKILRIPYYNIDNICEILTLKLSELDEFMKNNITKERN